LIFTCPTCFCQNRANSNDGWFTCENCNDSFTYKEVKYPSPTCVENLIEAVETVLFELDNYGTAKNSIDNLRKAVEKAKK
jgi:hypothetical protein